MLDAPRKPVFPQLPGIGEHGGESGVEESLTPAPPPEYEGHEHTPPTGVSRGKYYDQQRCNTICLLDVSSSLIIGHLELAY